MPGKRPALAIVAALVVWRLGAFAQDAPPPASPPPAVPPPAATAPAPAAAPTAAVPPAPLTEAAGIALQTAKDAFKGGHWQEALDGALVVLTEQPRHLEALYIAGVSERQTARYDAAEGHLKTLVDASPVFPLAHFQLGFVEFLEAESLTRDGNGDAAKAKYSESADQFGKELERNPAHAASISSRATALTRAGRFDDAIAAHEAWIALAPDKNEPLVSLAATYALSKKSTEAMATLDRLPNKDVKAVFDAVMSVAHVFTARGDWGASVPFLEKASETDPSSARARSNLTQAYARATQYDDAAKSLGLLLTMDPSPDDAEAAGEAIKATIGNGKKSLSLPGLDPPALLKLPIPRYPKGQDTTVETEVLVLAKIKATAAVAETLVVPNRIWKDLRATGFEQEAMDAVKRGKYAAGTKNNQPADLWLVVAVRFAKN